MDPRHHNPCHLIHHSTAAACSHHCYSPPPAPPPLPHFSPNLAHHQPPYSIQHVNFLTYPYNHQSYTHPPVEPQDKAVISSLLRRIAALESTLSRHVPANRYSLRDAAACTIQTHFRVYLVHRSRTLRQLKTLASIKASLNALKVSVSESGRVDWRAVSRKATDLLLRIDSIQGVDSMIRDGKRSISRDVDRFLGSIGLFVKKNKLSTIGLKSSKTRVLYNGRQIDTANFVSFGKDERGSKEKMRAHVDSTNKFCLVPDDHDDKVGIIELENFRILNSGKTGSLPKRNGDNQGKTKKKVAFAENGDHSRVFVCTKIHNSSEDDSVDEEMELVNNLHRRVQKIAVISNENGDDDQEAYSEDEESSHTRNGEENSKMVMRYEGSYRGDDVDFVFSAPTLVKMEPRADLAKTQMR